MYKEKWHVFHGGEKFFKDSKRIARELLFPSTEVNQSVPLGCEEEMSFLVDTSKLRYAEDITCDENGKYGKCSRAKSTITLDHNNIISEGVSTEGKTYTLERKYYKHRDTPAFQRIIYKLHGEEADHPVCLIRYVWKGERTELKFTPHGNQKKSDQPYIRAKKELIEDIKNTRWSSLHKVLTGLCEKHDGTDTQSMSSIPRDLRQIYRHTSVKGNASDLSELMEMKHSGEFVKSVEFSHAQDKGAMPKCVLFTEQQIKDMRINCCQNKKALMFDATLACGTVFVTISSYRHDQLVNNKNNTSVLLPGPMLLHSQKDQESYRYFGNVISKAINNANVNLFGTDGEAAIYKGLQGSESFRKSEHLMCMIHDRGTCKKKLTDLGVKKNARRILCAIYGEQVQETRYEGLADALTEEEYEARLAAWVPLWDVLESEETGRESEFSTWFLRYKSAQVKKSMFQTLRKKTGLGDPLQVTTITTNDGESINAMVARWIGGKKGWVQLAISFRDFVLATHQELEMAVIDPGNSEVAPACDDLQKTPVEMSRQEKPEVLQEAPLLDPKKSLSIKAEESGVCGFTSSELEAVWKKAENILGSSKNMVEFPTDANSTICFSGTTHFTIKKIRGNGFICESQCRSYVFFEHLLCEHTLAVAEWKGHLADFLVAINSKVRKSSTGRVLNKDLDRECSQNGNKKATKRKRANNTIGCKSTKVVPAPFSPQPFTVARKVELISRCYGCKRDFDDDMNVPPKDLILCKMDLKEWIDINTGELKKSTHLVPTYYHLSMDCVRITYPVAQIHDILLHGEVRQQLTEQHLMRLEEFGINID